MYKLWERVFRMDLIQARAGEEGVMEEEEDIPLRGEAHSVEVEKEGKMVI